MDYFNASQAAAEHSEPSDQNQIVILPSETLEAHGSRKSDIDDTISKDQKEELHRDSRVKLLSEGVTYYRHRYGPVSIIPSFVHLIAEPGLEATLTAVVSFKGWSRIQSLILRRLQRKSGQTIVRLYCLGRLVANLRLLKERKTPRLSYPLAFSVS